MTKKEKTELALLVDEIKALKQQQTRIAVTMNAMNSLLNRVLTAMVERN